MPRKNVRVLGGKPLIGYTIAAAHNAAARIDRVVVSTEDDEIADRRDDRSAPKCTFRSGRSSARPRRHADATRDHTRGERRSLQRDGRRTCRVPPAADLPVSTRSNDIDACIEAHGSSSTLTASFRYIGYRHQFNPHWVYLEQSRTALCNLATGERRADPTPTRTSAGIPPLGRGIRVPGKL